MLQSSRVQINSKLKEKNRMITYTYRSFNFLLQSDNKLLVSEMPKKLGVTDFVSEIKRVEKLP